MHELSKTSFELLTIQFAVGNNPPSKNTPSKGPAAAPLKLREIWKIQTKRSSPAYKVPFINTKCYQLIKLDKMISQQNKTKQTQKKQNKKQKNTNAPKLTR